MMFSYKGLKFDIPKRDTFIVTEADRQFQYHLKYNKPPRVVIDVGAHIGSMSILMAQKGAKVIALEPMLSNYKKLIGNINRNNMWDKIIPLRLVVTGYSGYVGIRTCSQVNSGQNSIEYKPDVFDIIEKVPCVSLNTVLSWVDKVDCLKMDVEGGEFEILDNTTSWNFRKIKTFDLEIHDLNNKDYFYNPRGYTVKGLINTLHKNGFHHKGQHLWYR